MVLKDIAYYVEESISSDNIEMSQYVTTDSLLQNKEGRVLASNLPPQPCSLTHFMVGDVLIANIRPYLKKVWKADIEGGCSKDVLVIRAKDGHCSEYIYALSMQDSFFENAMLGNKGTQMPRGDKNKIMEFPIWGHDKDEEKSTGKLVEAIQDKIALNNRMNAELEAMAKQLYDYWFVQFDFPDENGNPYKSSGGKMVYSPTLKREIPAGWELEYLGNLMDFSNGINYDKNIAGDKEYNIINVRNITSSTVFIVKDDLDRITLPQANANKYMIDEEDIIIARSGTPGATRLIDSPKDTIYCGFIIKGSPKYPWMKYYLFNILKQLEGTDATKTGGSILQNVSQDTLKGLPLVVPPKINVDMFNETIIRLFSRLNMNLEQSAQLTHLRDSLLPMLMNGQVSVE